MTDISKEKSELTEEELVELITNVIKIMPDQASTDFIANLFANIIVLYDMFEDLPKIQFGVAMCALEIMEAQSGQTVH